MLDDTAIALGQNNSRCVRRDDNHGCDPNFIEDPTGSTTTIMVSLMYEQLHLCTYMLHM